ncbi:hypothetical protein P4O66_010449 [Electrophorus voltai]|uniref:Uncharacterized protein n=1 Tax=Electrophorus voltai TaxID=2609070 RepID=A0AAD9DXM5_9TELE|nr:hypothetical protein P4O66_010449 [Electrophorus voltai]
MFPVIKLHRVDCKVCGSNLHDCVQCGVPLTLTEKAPSETTGPQPPVNNEVEDAGQVPLPPLPESPQHQGEQAEESEDESDSDDDEADNDDDWTLQQQSNFSFQLPAASTEGNTQFVRHPALDGVSKIIDDVNEYLRNRIPRESFGYMAPGYGRDHPLLGRNAWKTDAWGASFGAAGNSSTLGWYPLYNTLQQGVLYNTPATYASSAPKADFLVMAQNYQPQYSSWPENTVRFPDEVRAHSSNAAPAMGQSCRSQTEQRSSRKRRRETNSPSFSHCSETESVPRKMRR